MGLIDFAVSFLNTLQLPQCFLIISINSEASHSIELSQKIDELLQKLEPSKLEEKTLLNLFCYYENTGEFAKADNILSKLVARNNSAANAIDDRRSFYKRLMKKSREELAAGGMSRAQIRNKLNDLE